MGQTREDVGQNVAERVWWQAARRADARVARRLDHTQVVAGVCQRDDGALLEECFDFLPELGGAMGWARSGARRSSAR